LFVESSVEVASGLPGGSSNSSEVSSLAWESTKSKRRFGFGVRAERRKTGVARVDVLVSGVVIFDAISCCGVRDSTALVFTAGRLPVEDIEPETVGSVDLTVGFGAKLETCVE
jgi:hypothetical protein